MGGGFSRGPRLEDFLPHEAEQASGAATGAAGGGWYHRSEDWVDGCHDHKEVFHDAGPPPVMDHGANSHAELLHGLEEAQRRAREARAEAQRLIAEEREWQRHHQDREPSGSPLSDSDPRPGQPSPSELSEQQWWWEAQQEQAAAAAAAAEAATQRMHEEEWLRARSEATERAQQWQKQAYEQMRADEEERRQRFEEWARQYVREPGAFWTGAEPKMSQEEREKVVEAHEERWQSFEKGSPDKARITKADVPFPDDRELECMTQMATEGAQGDAPPSPSGDFKKLMKRWHPDKFTQKYGKKLDDGEKEDILNQVKEVFQKIQELKKGGQEKATD